MFFERENYLNKLISKINDNRIKIVTGLRRVGKSVLLNELFYNYLIKSGVYQDHIIQIALDDYKNKEFLNPDNLYKYVIENIKDTSTYFLLLDEIQFVDDFTHLLLGFYHIKNLNVYVSGSNAKFLSKDIVSEFNDRGVEIKIYPLSFKEYFELTKQNIDEAYINYIKYGGLPKLIDYNNEIEKKEYLLSVLKETYIKDLNERYRIKHKEEFKELISFLASSIGSKFSALKLFNSFNSIKKEKITTYTLNNYLEYLKDSFLIDEVEKDNLKGKKIINSVKKYFYNDLGIRNAILSFNNLEETHLMENLIFNELIKRGYEINLGSLIYNGKDKNQKSYRKELEIDFIARKNNKTYYIQSAYEINNEGKRGQEIRPFNLLKDSNKKVVIVKNGYITSKDEKGYLYLNLYDFLLNEDSLDL